MLLGVLAQLVPVELFDVAVRVAYSPQDFAVAVSALRDDLADEGAVLAEFSRDFGAYPGRGSGIIDFALAEAPRGRGGRVDALEVGGADGASACEADVGYQGLGEWYCAVVGLQMPSVSARRVREDVEPVGWADVSGASGPAVW